MKALDAGEEFPDLMVGDYVDPEHDLNVSEFKDEDDDE